MASVKSKPHSESVSVRDNVRAWEFLAFGLALSILGHLTSSATRKLPLNKYIQYMMHQGF